MSLQPVSGYQHQRVSGTAAGTTVVKASTTVLHKIIMGQNKTGTITVYDNASGTASGILGNFDNTCGTRPLSIPINAQMRKGIVAELGGTTDALFIYQ
jgi:hypothetical protein